MSLILTQARSAASLLTPWYTAWERDVFRADVRESEGARALAVCEHQSRRTDWRESRKQAQGREGWEPAGEGGGGAGS